MNANNFPKVVKTADAYNPVAGSYSYIELQIEAHSVPTDKYLPLTGVWATEESISGWLWDRRRLENLSNVQTFYDTFVGGHEVGLRDGTVLDDWQSGSIEGLSYLGIAELPSGILRSWTPQVQTGTYGHNWEVRRLHSDHSVQEAFDTADNYVSGNNAHEIRDDAMWSTLEVALYYREDDSTITKYYDFRYVDEFTGEIDTGASPWERKTGVVAGVPQWADLDPNKHEFMILEQGGVGSGAPYDVVLNQDWSVVVGVWTSSPPELTCPAAYVDAIYEDKGTGAGDGGYVYTRFLPVQPGTMAMITRAGAVLDSGWTEQSTLDFSGPTDQHYAVDYDRGIVQLPGFQADDLVLDTALVGAILETEVNCYFDDETFAQYPDQGVIAIGVELIKYERKTRHGFEQCTKDYLGTGDLAHAQGAIISHQQMGMPITDEIMLGYTAMPRIDYEVTDHDVRTANRGQWVDVRPSKSVDSSDVLQLWSGDISLGSIALSVDRALVGGNIWGPVYFGTDAAKVTATAYDKMGNVVEGISVTIEIDSGGGTLGGSGTDYTGISNTKGQLHTLYNAPYDQEEIEQQVTATTVAAGDTTLTVPTLEPDLDADDIWIFQVVKHDPVTGTVGLVGDVEAWANTPADPRGESYVQVSEVVGAEYEGGWAYVTGTSYTISKVENPVVGSVTVSRLYLTAALPLGTLVGDETRLYMPDATEWTDWTDGTRVILYEWDASASHPIVDTPPAATGAWMPVRPDVVGSGSLVFTSKSLPIPDSSTNTVNLGAYVVVAPSRVTLVASGVDPVSGQTITSDPLRLDLLLPSYLVGVDESGAAPIPVGWTLVTPSYNIGAGLGGANFITINPEARGFNSFNLTGTN